MRLTNRNCDVRFVCARLAATGRVLFDTPLTSQHNTPNRGACFVCQNKHLETPSPTPAVPHGFTISWVWCSQAPGTRRQKTPFVWQCSVRSRLLPISLRGSVCSVVAVVGTTTIALCVASDYDHLQHSPAATELTPYHWRLWPTLNTMMFTHKSYRRAVCRHVAGKQRPS